MKLYWQKLYNAKLRHKMFLLQKFLILCLHWPQMFRASTEWLWYCAELTSGRVFIPRLYNCAETTILLGQRQLLGQRLPKNASAGTETSGRENSSETIWTPPSSIHLLCSLLCRHYCLLALLRAFWEGSSSMHGKVQCTWKASLFDTVCVRSQFATALILCLHWHV